MYTGVACMVADAALQVQNAAACFSSVPFNPAFFLVFLFVVLSLGPSVVYFSARALSRIF